MGSSIREQLHTSAGYGVPQLAFSLEGFGIGVRALAGTRDGGMGGVHDFAASSGRGCLFLGGELSCGSDRGRVTEGTYRDEDGRDNGRGGGGVRVRGDC